MAQPAGTPAARRGHRPRPRGGEERRKPSLGIVALTAAGVAAIAVGACGGTGGNGGGTSPGRTSGAATVAAAKGGRLTVLSAADVDYLDPGEVYYTFGYMVQYAVNRPLYSYAPGDAHKPVPDLATAGPEISSDEKTITVHLKKGVRYSPPIDREVRAQDVEYAFERAFSKHVPSGYAGTYFGSIVGTPAKPNTGEIKPISGIRTPDDHTIVFKLKTRSAALVSQALVMPITVPVPREYASRFDRETPSTYDQHVAFTGPYMVANDPQTGRLTGRAPGKSIDIVRNPNWDASTDYRPAYLDEIHIQEGNDDLAVAARRALNGSAMVCCDSPQPPAQVLKQAVQHHRDQVLLVPAGATLYISLNTTVKPLDNIDVRKAIVAVSDRNALRLTTGGKVSGSIAGGWIPPGVPGFEEAGGPRQNTDLDVLRSPAGNPALARRYMLAAKQRDPSLPIDGTGRWTGTEKLFTVASNADPARKTAEAFQSQIEKLGFRLNLRVMPEETMLTRFLEVPAQNVALGPSAGWFRDFADPQSVLDPTFNGDNILQEGNANLSELDVPAINDAMNAAALVPAGPRRNRSWARINHMVAEQAPAVPYLWPNDAVVQSRDVAGVASAYFGTHDLSFTSIKR